MLHVQFNISLMRAYLINIRMILFGSIKKINNLGRKLDVFLRRFKLEENEGRERFVNCLRFGTFGDKASDAVIERLKDTSLGQLEKLVGIVRAELSLIIELFQDNFYNGLVQINLLWNMITRLPGLPRVSGVKREVFNRIFSTQQSLVALLQRKLLQVINFLLFLYNTKLRLSNAQPKSEHIFEKGKIVDLQMLFGYLASCNSIFLVDLSEIISGKQSLNTDPN